ncbi:MAG TPA: hypothetical protein VGO52_18675 [Hyphomonadaceae bacterium]|jgi:hypothetical protein|nr:hypothetical protein [Hyphomonadaceae bacterium]
MSSVFQHLIELAEKLSDADQERLGREMEKRVQELALVAEVKARQQGYPQSFLDPDDA